MLGEIDGDILGETEGATEGEIDGLIEGDSDGDNEMLGETLGESEGLSDTLGDTEGDIDGEIDGEVDPATSAPLNVCQAPCSITCHAPWFIRLAIFYTPKLIENPAPIQLDPEPKEKSPLGASVNNGSYAVAFAPLVTFVTSVVLPW